MELKLNSGDVITIPDDCKAVIKDNVITVEKEEQEFKDGDILCCKYHEKNYYAIYKCKINNSVAYFYIFYNSYYDIFYYDGVFLIEGFVLATKEEKQLLLDAMHADGKDWDADKKQIVDYRWKPNYREVYYHINYSLDIQIDSLVWYGDALDEIYFSNGNCFKTIDEAKKYADKFVEILKDRKL